MMADVRLAVRSLLKNRGFAAVALVTIALGMGANTAVFSVLNAALLRPLPFSDPERLVAIYETAQRATVERRSVSYPAFQDWHHELRSFDSVAVFDDEGFTVVAGGVAERERGERVSASYFDLLGERPLLGRTFTTSEDVAGQGCSVVLGEALWRRRFEADRGIIGRSLAIDAKSCTVLGVMPQSFSGVSDRAGLWLPITVMTPRDVLENRGNRGMSVVARLRADVTIESARAELAALSLNLRRQYPRELSDRSADLGPLRDEYVGDVRPTLLVLLGAVAFVLLIACTNVANLMLARAASRQREMAIRTALGANRRRLLRQILTESMVLSIAGGISGLLMAAWAADLLVAYNPDPFPSFVSIRVDPRVLAFTFALCVAAGLLFGAVPALAMTRGDITIGLKEGARDSSQGDSPRLHQMLVMSEIALAVVLLTGAGLMLRTIGALRSFDPGFRREGLISARVSLAEAAYSTTASVRFAEQLLGRVRALPTVESATIASDVPSGTSSTAQTVSIEGRDAGAPRIRVYTHRVTPGFFRTIGTPLLAGRDFTERDIDRHDALGTAIISQRMARRHWGDTSPLSERLRLGERLYTVVGVVGDVRHRALVEEPTADPDVYFPLAQIPTRNLAVLARTTGSPDALAQAIRVEVHRLDPAVPVYALATGPELLSTQTSVARFGTFLLGTFALLALLLTIVGIYGVTAYTVSRQARQIGIRMALGATRRDVLRLVLGSGMTVIVAGLTAGTAAAMALTRLLTSLMYGVSPTDPLTFGGATTVLTAAALLACVAPARKAIKIEPALALRSE